MMTALLYLDGLAERRYVHHAYFSRNIDADNAFQFSPPRWFLLSFKSSLEASLYLE